MACPEWGRRGGRCRDSPRATAQARLPLGPRSALRIDDAVDLYVADLRRQGKAVRTCDDYWCKLAGLSDRPNRRGSTVDAVTPDDCRRYLDRWSGASSSTMAHSVSVLNGFLWWVYE